MTRRGRDGGMITAETAMIAPFGIAFCLLLVWVVGLAITQVRLVDASREAARALARGDAVAVARAAARRVAPAGSVVTMRSADGAVSVTVRVRARSPIPFFHGVGERRLQAHTVAALEDP